MPVVLQSEVAECGLACVAMIAEYHGRATDLQSLRKVADPGTRGSTMKDLVDVADTLGFSVRSLKLGLRQLDKLKLPAILHWNLVHYVVLVSHHDDEYVVHDPALGCRVLSAADFSRSFTGLAQELAPRPDFSRGDDRTPVRLAWIIDRKGIYLQLVGILLALAFAMQMLVTSVPFTAQVVLDHALASNDTMPLLLATVIGAIGLAAYCTLLVIRFRVAAYLNTLLDMGGTQKLIAKILSMPYDFFARRDIGSLLTRFANLAELRRLLSQGLADSAIDALVAVLLLVALISFLPSAAMASLGGLALYALVRALRRRNERDLVGEMFHAAGGEHASLIETLAKVETVKANALEQMRERFWASRFITYQNSVVHKSRADLANTITLVWALGLAYGVGAWVVVSAVAQGGLTLGAGFTAFALMVLFLRRSSVFVDKLLEFLVAKVHLDNLADVVHGDAEPASLHHHTESVGSTAVTLELRDLGFRHSEKEPFVLRHVSFTVKAGSCTAITGPSGCGKSTLLSLILGLRRPTEGAILVDGVPLEDWDIRRLRRRIGSVLQSDQLFAGSVHENVSFFDADSDPARFDEVIRACALAEVIARLPMQRHTFIGDTPTFSGGERQRLLLARALFKRPSLLLLDEATSHLDEATEMQVNESIRASGATRIMAAHRQQTIALADEVIVLGASKQGWTTVIDMRKEPIYAA